jgi:UDP-N-acetylglucosamine 2-epimerase (non-hydrolysing)
VKIAIIIGTRPEFVQCTQVVKELNKSHETILIHTGQHYDYSMNKLFFNELKIPEPDYHLEVGSGSHGQQTGDMLKKIETVLEDSKSNLVLVFGDTNSTLAGALAASKLHIKVGHIESGMRSFDRSMPEEINRVITDHISNILFCSTKSAMKNLKMEGIRKNIFFSGDVTVDTLENNKKLAEKRSTILHEYKLKSKEYLIATIHRSSNTDNINNLKNIVKAFCDIEETLIFPVHPRTKGVLKKYNLWDILEEKKSIKLVEPLGYFDFLKLMNNAKKILTDSGGIQKEAYILKVPCITIRDNTEWVETVEDGWNVLTGANRKKIVEHVQYFYPECIQKDVFGKNASNKIAQIINTID